MKKTVSMLLMLVLLLAAVPAMAKDCWYNEKYGTHDFEQVDVRLPSCTVDGYYELECRQCGYSDWVLSQKAYGHAWRKVSETKATCTSKGSVTYECDNCHERKTEKGKALGHTYGAWQITEPAGILSMGTRRRSCTQCGSVDEQRFYPEGTLYRGVNDREAVRALQQKLQELCFLQDKVDGIFGKNTEQAVRDFEVAFGFPDDGVAWPAVQASVTEVWERWLSDAPEAPEATGVPGEPDESEMEANTLVDFCIRGAEEQWLMCTNHTTMVQTAQALYQAATTDAERVRALRQIRALWQGELDILYETWLNAAPDAEKSLVLSGKATFAGYLTTQEMIWKQQYGADSIQALEQVNAALQEQCLQLCGLATGGGAGE